MSSAPGSRRLVSLEREREIAQQAEAIAIHEFGYGPVDPLHLIEVDGHITVSIGNYGDAFDGLLEYESGEFHIYANLDRIDRVDEGRGAFTLSHELGHYCLTEHRQWMMATPDSRQQCFLFSDDEHALPQEREADIFASNLLIPRSSFRKRVRMPAPSFDVIEDTANFFHGSLTSTAIRFCELEPFPCALIRWSESGECLWTKLSPRVRSYYGPITRNLQGLRAASPTAKILQVPSDLATRTKATTTSEVWFPHWREHITRHTNLDLQSAILDEHVVPLGRHGYLTLICGHSWTNLPAVRDD